MQHHFAKGIVAAIWVLIIAASLIRPSETRGQGDIKIGPDQSKASMAETFAWLRQRVPEFGTFTYEEYDSTINYKPGSTWPASITTFTTVHQMRVDFKGPLFTAARYNSNNVPLGQLEIGTSNLSSSSFKN